MDLKILAISGGLINLVACLVMMIDKSYAIKNKWRLSEAFLLSFSLFGGGAGLMMGMILFRHKLSKMKFRVIGPLGIFLYAAIIFYFIWIGKIVWL